MVVARINKINDLISSGETVSILVGPNGSGKSSLLLELARFNRNTRDVIVISNTPHDRFSGLRNTKRISAGRSDQSPPKIVKRAIVDSLNEEGSQYYQISAILEHCGYDPQFGFAIEYFENRIPMRGDLFTEIRNYLDKNPRARHHNLPNLNQIIEMATYHLQQFKRGRHIWINAGSPANEFSLSRDFASVLQLETILRRMGVINKIRVLLRRESDGVVIDMERASSGQLALISSMLFLITNVDDHPLIIIDEPENSLHPSWQRDYVAKILVAMNFRNASIIMATHAPLVVTGALASNPDLISIFVMRDGFPERLEMGAADNSPKSIEALLWRAFDVITPANHFVSERIVDEISRFEKGEVPKSQVLSLIKRMEAESFEERQMSFFQAVRELVSKIEAKLTAGPKDDG